MNDFIRSESVEELKSDNRFKVVMGENGVKMYVNGDKNPLAVDTESQSKAKDLFVELNSLPGASSEVQEL